MKDMKIKGTGNSRFLKSNIPAGTTIEQLIAMLNAGSFPFDFNGVNAEGIEEMGSALNKANLIKDETAALFGLGSDAVPDDVLAMLSPMMQYAWHRKHTSYTESQTAAPTTWSTAPGVFDGYPVTVSYSNSISFSSDGTITLVNATSAQVTADTFLNTVRGKYVKGLSTNNPGTSTNTIYYINSNATTGNATANTTGVSRKPFINSGAFIVSAFVSEVLDYVVSPNRNEYPDSGTVDGKEYKYIGVPFKNLFYAPRIATGSYVGTNALIRNIAIGFEADLVIVLATYTRGNVNSSAYWYERIGVASKNGYNGYGSSGNIGSLIISGSTLVLEADAAGYQSRAFNYSGRAYTWWAFKA